ncbi:MAG: ribonuclease E/G, partial [Microvirga sp.]
FDEAGTSEGSADVETADSGALAPVGVETASDVESEPDRPAQPEREPERLAAANDERILTVAAIEAVVGPEAERPQAPSEPDPEPVAVVLTPSDPSRPKRAGWWSRAKSVLSGE